MVRYGWKLPKRIQAPHPREVLSPVVGVVTPAESLQERLKNDAEATHAGLSTATRKASVSLAELDGDEGQRLGETERRGKQRRATAWMARAAGAAGPLILGFRLTYPLPTEEERAEMRAIDAKLDAFVAKLRGNFSRPNRPEHPRGPRTYALHLPACGACSCLLWIRCPHHAVSHRGAARETWSDNGAILHTIAPTEVEGCRGLRSAKRELKSHNENRT